MLSPFHLTIDLKECEANKNLTSQFNIICYMTGLCRVLNLTMEGPPLVKTFRDPNDSTKCGVTACQILSESLLSLHTYPEFNAIYIDIFSCKKFNATLAVNYSQTFFGAGDSKINRVERMSLSEILLSDESLKGLITKVTRLTPQSSLS